MLERFRSEVRWGLRHAGRRPLFAGAVSATLALCIATATTAFGLATAILWRPLPFRDAAALVFVWEHADRDGQRQPSRVTAARFAEWRDHATSFDSLSLFGAAGFSLDTAEGAQPIRGVRVSADFFETLGVPPVLGRAFAADDETPGRERVVVLSHAFWQQRLGARSDAIGMPLRLNGDLYTIVGVMPPIVFPGWPVNPADVIVDAASREIWVPIARAPGFDQNARAHVFGVIGRLARGISISHATDELDAMTRPGGIDPHGARLTPLREQFVRSARLPLLVLFGAALAVILVACTNLAALHLSLFEGRRRELAVRAAIGATAGQLAGQLAAESVVLALAGGGVGLALAAYALARLPDLLPPSVPFMTPTTLDLPTAAFAVVLAAVTIAMLVAWPAGSLFARRRSLTGAVARPHPNIYRGLIVVQIAVSVALTVAAALLGRSLWSVRSVDPGFVLPGVVVATVGLPSGAGATPASVVSFEDRVVQTAGALAGVTGVALAYDHPLEANWTDTYALTGVVADSRQAEGQAQLRIVSPGYFTSVGVEVTEGRSFENRDGLARGGVAVVNEAFNRFHGGHSVGRRLRTAAPRLTWGNEVPGEYEIVGVVEDERFKGLEHPSEPAVYLSTRQFPQTSFSLLIRTSARSAAVMGDLRAVLRRLDPGATLSSPTTLSAILDEQLVARRLTTDVVGAFAAVALLLATLGLYSLLAMFVAKATREIGVRLAIGASPRRVARQVATRGFSYIAIGVALGSVLSLAAGQFLESWLVGVSARDPATFAAVAFVLAGSGALSIIAPAVRAARIDPAVALRNE